LSVAAAVEQALHPPAQVLQQNVCFVAHIIPDNLPHTSLMRKLPKRCPICCPLDHSQAQLVNSKPLGRGLVPQELLTSKAEEASGDND